MPDKPADPAVTPATAPLPPAKQRDAGERSRFLAPLFGGILAGLGAGMLMALFWLGPARDRFDFLFADFTIETCLEANGVEDMLPAFAEANVIACYNRLVRQGQLNEFQIRRVNFQTQHVADTVTLWMVVTLTVCGVALAAWQIFASSRLVTTQPEKLTSELSIERGKIFVRSSVTGLLILLVSFAFFYVYVVWIYQLREWSDDAKVVPLPDDLLGLQEVDETPTLGINQPGQP